MIDPKRLDELEALALASVSLASGPTGDTAYMTVEVRNDLPALIATAREAVEMREALEAWHAAFEGQHILDIVLRDGRTTAARVRMTRKALGIGQ